MSRRRTNRLILIALAAAMLLALLCSTAKASDGLDISAKSAVLIEASTGKVLWAKSAHEKLPMASTTKIMTALVAIEYGNLEELVTVGEEAYGVEGSSIYLELGEKMSLKDMLYGLMLRSGNDAAVAIAVHVGGSVEGFVELMNKKAVELGALNTHFVTPNGLHDEQHYTTAYDLALISSAALKNESFRRLVSATYYRAETGTEQRTWKNKNRLLWEYEGCTGLKTGYTSAAGKCLAASASRDGMELVSIVMSCPNMFPDSKALLDYGFENYKMATVLHQGDVVARTRLLGSDKNVLELVVDRDIIVPVPAMGSASIKTSVKIDGAELPVTMGQVLGSVQLFENGRLVGKASLLAASAAGKIGYGWYVDLLFNNWGSWSGS